MPFLEILTRHYSKRPDSLEANQASLDALVGTDWQQTMLIDNVGQGVPWANQQLGLYAPQLEGDYIWILDDDDQCIYPALVTDLQSIAAQHDPDVIFVRMEHGPELGILPNDANWGAAPMLRGIGSSAFVVRRSLWQKRAEAWCRNEYESDFRFIDAIWKTRSRFYWHDIIASRVTRRSLGAPEALGARPKWGVTEVGEYKMLREHLPGLFGGAQRSLLYIGANQVRPPYHTYRLRLGGWSLNLFEIFPGNVAHHQATGIFDSVTQGDVRHDPLPAGTFDGVFWWHGVEHIAKADLAATLARLEAVAPLVVLGCPDGHSPQAAVYGNEAERHQWDVQAEDLQRLGYTVMPYQVTGTDYNTRRHLLAWKRGDA